MALQTKTKAAFDASAHLTNVQIVDLPKFLAAILKNAEAVAAELTHLRDEWTGVVGGAAGGSDSASSIGTIGTISATDLSAWARALRDAARTIADELANMAVLPPSNHDHDSKYIRRDGTTGLLGDWVAGTLYTITARAFASNVASGTPPLIIASTDLVANLNADLLDGLHAAAFALAAAGLSDLVITDVTGAGTISNKTYFDSGGTSPADAQLTAAESDNDSITIAFTVYARGANWQPITVTASGAGATPVISTNGTWTQQGSSRVFSGTATLTDADTTGTITLTDSDGATTTFAYIRSTAVSLGASVAQSIRHLGRSRTGKYRSWV